MQQCFPLENMEHMLCNAILILFHAKYLKKSLLRGYATIEMLLVHSNYGQQERICGILKLHTRYRNFSQSRELANIFKVHAG